MISNKTLTELQSLAAAKIKQSLERHDFEDALIATHVLGELIQLGSEWGEEDEEEM